MLYLARLRMEKARKASWKEGAETERPLIRIEWEFYANELETALKG